MLFLLLAILCSALVSVMMRIGTARVQNNIGMLTVNYCTCLAAALLYTDGFAFVPASPSLPRTLLLGAVNGVLYLTSFVAFQYNVQKNGVVLSSVFMKLGLLVPLTVSILWFHEMPAIPHWIGFALAILAILLINLQSGEGKKANGGLLVLLLLLGGGAEAMSKVFQEIGDGAHASQFLLYTFAAALLLCIGFLLWKKQRIGKPEILYGILIGIPNFFSAKCMLRAIGDVPAVVAYPTFSVATILAVSLVGVIAFRERLRKVQWAAVGIIVAALVLLNL